MIYTLITIIITIVSYIPINKYLFPLINRLFNYIITRHQQHQDEELNDLNIKKINNNIYETQINFLSKQLNTLQQMLNNKQDDLNQMNEQLNHLNQQIIKFQNEINIYKKYACYNNECKFRCVNNNK